MRRKLTRAQRRALNLIRGGRKLIVEREPDTGRVRVFLYSLRGDVARCHAATFETLLEAGLIVKIRGFNGTIQQYGMRRRTAA